MSNDAEDLKELAEKVIPELSDKLHKGSLGRIGIVGGCTQYTGAPYFAGITSLKIGADLVYIFCTKEAAVPIKSYSPETIVIPVLDSENALEQLDNYFDKLHTIVIGPGLGSCFVYTFFTNSLMLNKNIVIEASFLQAAARWWKTRLSILLTVWSEKALYSF